MEEVQLAQTSGDPDLIDKATGKGKLASGEAYVFPAIEKHLVHVELELEEYDRQTGKKTSTPRVQKFYPDEFVRLEQEGQFAFHRVEILHEPSKALPKGLKASLEDNETKELQPLVKSQPGAGTPLTDILDAKTEAELRGAHKNLYPTVDNKGLSKEELVSDIRALIGEYSQEQNAELKQQHLNRLRGLGLVQ